MSHGINAAENVTHSKRARHSLLQTSRLQVRGDLPAGLPVVSPSSHKAVKLNKANQKLRLLQQLAKLALRHAV